MRKRTAWAAILLILAMLLYGCGAGTAQKSADSAVSGGSTGFGGVEAPAAQPAPAPAPTAPMAPPPMADGEESNTGAPVGESTPVTDRKIIRNAEIEVKVKDADEAISAIEQSVQASGGYLQESRVEGTREQGRRVSISVRVPAGSYTSLLDMVAGLGEQLDLRQWTNDVTEEYLDLDARIKTKEVHLAQLQRLYEQTGSITELIELEREIGRVTAELESIKGRFTFLSNQVAFSTVRIQLFEPGVPTPTREPQNLWERMRDGFLFSWHSMVDLGEELLVGIVAMIPRLLFLAVIGGIIWLVVRLVINRRRGGGGGGGGADKAA